MLLLPQTFTKHQNACDHAIIVLDVTVEAARAHEMHAGVEAAGKVAHGPVHVQCHVRMLAVGIADGHGFAGRIDALVLDDGREGFLAAERIVLEQFDGSIAEKSVHIVPLVGKSVGYDVVVLDEIDLTDRFKVDSIDQESDEDGEQEDENGEEDDETGATRRR